MAKSNKNVVQPTIRVDGDTKAHAFEEMFEDGSTIEIKSVGYTKLPNSNTYVAYTIYSKGTQITKIEVEEPNLRPIAEESAKIAFITNFSSNDFEEG